MAESDNASEKPKGQIVKDGYLPVSEFLFDRSGAGSPYGEEIEFPLPAESLVYRHPEPQPTRER
jgi:succinate dehydrogenase / fumarate reductase iron-sulfur subunit